MRKSVPNGWDCSRKQGAKKDDLKFKRLYILTLIMNRIENNFAMLPCYYVPACKKEKCTIVSNPVEISIFLFFKIRIGVTA